MEYIIGIDFDGTVVTHEYPRVGRDIGAVPVLKRLVDSGNKLILFTMRDSRNGTLQDAINWFKENGIELYGVNTNPTQADWTDSPKAHCNFYIDDAALGIPKNFDWKTGRNYVDWKRVEKLLEEEGLFEDFGEDEDFWDDVEMDGYNDNTQNEGKKMGKVKLTEQQLHSLISESVKRVLNEADGNEIMRGLFGNENLGQWLRSERDKEGYFIVDCAEYDGTINNKIEPCYILKPEDIDEEEGEVMINGNPEFVITENTNFYADNSGSNFCQAGDLVFEYNGEYAFYRKGLNAPCGFTNGDAIVGTKDEIMDYIEEFFGQN